MAVLIANFVGGNLGIELKRTATMLSIVLMAQVMLINYMEVGQKAHA